MTSDADAESVIEVAEKRTEPEPDGNQNVASNVWTSRRRLKQEADPPRGEVDGIVDELVDAGDLFEWHGLIAPSTEEHLRAIIGSENQSDVPRLHLIKAAKRRLNEDGA